MVQFLTTNLTDFMNFLGLMPAALDRIYRIFQNFAWVASALGNHRIH
jgi:hypothetical protein